MKITIIKHGKTDYNLEGKRQGRTDLSLNTVGKKEARELKDRVKNDFTIIISSPLKRAYETAQILFPDKKIITNKLLLEYDFGELEGVKFSTPLSEFPDNKIEEYNGIKFLMPNKGETFENIVNRCKNFIQYLKNKFEEKDQIAVVTHSTNMEIFKALTGEKSWYTYLGQAKQFHGFVVVEI